MKRRAWPGGTRQRARFHRELRGQEQAVAQSRAQGGIASRARGKPTVKKLLLLAVLPLLTAGLARAENTTPPCPVGADTLGVSRVAEIDTAGGPLFGDQYPPTSLLQKGEVVLT